MADLHIQCLCLLVCPRRLRQRARASVVQSKTTQNQLQLARRVGLESISTILRPSLPAALYVVEEGLRVRAGIFGGEARVRGEGGQADVVRIVFSFVLLRRRARGREQLLVGREKILPPQEVFGTPVEEGVAMDIIYNV